MSQDNAPYFTNLNKKEKIWETENIAVTTNSGPPKPNLNYSVKQASSSLTLAAPTTLNNPDFVASTIFKPIYSDDYLNRLANAWEFDYLIRTGINRLVYFILGKTDEIKTNLYPAIGDQITSDLQAKNELSKIKIVRNANDIAASVISSQFKIQEQKDLQKTIANVDRVSKIYSTLSKPVKSTFVFGRGALWIDRAESEIRDLAIPVNAPIGLKPLNSRYLGQVMVDPDTWKLTNIEYRDPRFRVENDNITSSTTSPPDANPTTFLPIDDLIYFTRDDDNMTRNGYNYGLSTVQAILALSEETRRINTKVMPELNESQWCGTGFWKVPGWSAKDIQDFSNSIQPGKQVMLNSPEVEFQETHLQFDYPSLLAVRDSNEKKILSAFGIPSFLMNFDNIGGSTASKMSGDVLLAFQESIIESERAWIREVLDEYWYGRLLRAYFPNDQYINIKLKVVTEFQNISFESFFEKALALQTLVSNKLISVKEAREILSFPENNPDLMTQPSTNPSQQPQDPTQDPMRQVMPNVPSSSPTNGPPEFQMKRGLNNQ